MFRSYTVGLKAALLVFSIFGILLTAGPAAQIQAAPLAPGTKAPPFVTRTLSGQRLSLQDFRGKVVLVDFWATYCGACRIAMPTLQGLNERFGKRGLRIIGMSVDDSRSLAQIGPVVKAHGVRYIITAAPAANISAAQAFHVDGLPSQYLIDKRGVVRWSQAGYSLDEPKELAVLIKRLLSERA